MGIGWVSGGLGLERSEITDGIMVKEGRGFVGKGDGGVRGILGKFQCQLIVKLDVVNGGASLKVLGGRGGGDRPCDRFRSTAR